MPEPIVPPSVADVEDARVRIEGIARRTPTVHLDDAGSIVCKLEALQRTGSFKIRGAWNRMAQVDPQARKEGFITTSAGNHGRAVAWCARRLEAPCTVIVPEDAVEAKVEAMRALGAQVRSVPHEELMAGIAAGRWTKGAATFVHPFADAAIIAGQGTVGLELAEDLEQPPRTVLVPVGGGGLASGVATVLSQRFPDARILGVQASGSAPLAASFEAGSPADVGHADTFADGIAVSRVFEEMWPLLHDLLDGALTVDDAALRRAIAHLAREARVVAEGAGAAAVAAAFAHEDALEGPLACVVSGGNIQPSELARILQDA